MLLYPYKYKHQIYRHKRSIRIINPELVEGIWYKFKQALNHLIFSINLKYVGQCSLD